jgi:hypothetical protein
VEVFFYLYFRANNKIFAEKLTLFTNRIICLVFCSGTIASGTIRNNIGKNLKEESLHPAEKIL